MAKQKKTLVVKLSIGGIRDTLKSLKELGDEAQQQIRDRSWDMAQDLASLARAAATVAPAPQARLIARTVRAQRGRAPVVQAGGTRKLGRYRVPAWRLLFASEFGQNEPSGWYRNVKYRGSTGEQYPPHRGRQGYWFFPTVESQQDRIDREWNAAATEIIAAFTSGGDT